MDGELLTGGGLNQVFRVGDAVRRPAGPWASRVHELLRHLAPLGIAPVPLGLDGSHELLSYLPGDVGHVFPSDDESLVASALMLRRLHDATLDLVDLRDGWQHPAREPVEVVLHGDFAPYNTVYRDGVPVGVFDFDSAHPGPRWWDVSWAIIQFVFGLPHDRKRRAQLFCEAYGCGYDDEHVLTRLEDAIRLIREHPAFVQQRADRHDDYYLGLVRWVSETGGARF